jgi:hypothetical protein
MISLASKKDMVTAIFADLPEKEWKKTKVEVQQAGTFFE